MQEPKPKNNHGLQPPNTSDPRPQELTTGGASGGSKNDRVDPQPPASNFEAPSGGRAPPNERGKKPAGTVSDTREDAPNDKTPSSENKPKPLEDRKAPPVPTQPFVLPILDVNCRKKYPPGTVIILRHTEPSADPDAPFKASSQMTHTHKYEDTEEGMTCSVRRPAVVIDSYEDRFQYIPMRTNGGKGIVHIKPGKRTEHLRLIAYGEYLGTDVNDSPHQSVEFMKSEKDQNRKWGGNSYFNVTEMHTSQPVSRIQVLGRLCPGEVARIDALISALKYGVVPPVDAGLNARSISQYLIDQNATDAEFRHEKPRRYTGPSSSRRPRDVRRDEEQRGNYRGRSQDRRGRSPSKNRNDDDSRFESPQPYRHGDPNRGRSRGRRSRSPTPEIFRHNDPRKNSYRDRSCDERSRRRSDRY